MEAYFENIAWQRQNISQQITHAHGQDVSPDGAGFEPLVVHEEDESITHQARCHQQKKEGESWRERKRELAVAEVQEFFLLHDAGIGKIVSHCGVLGLIPLHKKWGVV